MKEETKLEEKKKKRVFKIYININTNKLKKHARERPERIEFDGSIIGHKKYINIDISKINFDTKKRCGF